MYIMVAGCGGCSATVSATAWKDPGLTHVSLYLYPFPSIQSSNRSLDEPVTITQNEGAISNGERSETVIAPRQMTDSIHVRVNASAVTMIRQARYTLDALARDSCDC